MTTQQGFSLAVSGKGMMLGMFITDGMERWGEEVTMYDHTAAFQAARKGEAKLGESGYGNKGARDMAKKIRAHDANPPKIDIRVQFVTFGKREICIVSGNGQQRTVRLDKAKLDWQGLEHALEECFKAVDEIRGATQAKPRFIKRPKAKPAAVS
ncbi:hypothetical protein FHY55_03960 [Oceanicola sp. D3]|uniref:hypothetical protein n=1 Tax=Oceanicola sp. D3 TaxID=2587163 RepID=UPI001123D831|nr:hypothetical protein [Oceanicola sp. D3]QDC08450.1 hypothetical protein FHY55_03960 [Oceanicola sp. D3]